MNRDPAMPRFFVIQALRIAGVALCLLGVLVLAGRIDWPRPAGLALAVIGLLDAAIVPVLLARRWKSPKP